MMEKINNNENMMAMFVAMLGQAIASEVAVILPGLISAVQARSSEDKGLYTIATAAAYLDVSQRKLRAMVIDREITHRRIGKCIKFTLKDLDNYIEKRAKRPALF
jgi:excisionase family DNA binding protein